DRRPAISDQGPPPSLGNLHGRHPHLQPSELDPTAWNEELRRCKCHVPPRMRAHPIGTGPFKFVEFKPNGAVKVVRNPIIGSRGGPISTRLSTQMPNPATSILAFGAGKFDRTGQGIMSIEIVGLGRSLQWSRSICKSWESDISPNLLVEKIGSAR